MKTSPIEFGDKVTYIDMGDLIRARVCGWYDEAGTRVYQVYVESINGKPAHGQSIINHDRALLDDELGAVLELVAWETKWRTSGSIRNYSPMFDRNVFPSDLERKGMLSAKNYGPETFGHTEYTLTAAAFEIAKLAASAEVMV